METQNTSKTQPGADIAAETRTPEVVSGHAPRHLTLFENVKLTIKVLAIAGVLGGLLWGLEAWTSGW